MSRSGYSDDIDNWQLIKWRGAVASAIRGKRGQLFLMELIAAMDALPEPKLIAHALEQDGCVCALGAVGKRRGIEMGSVDPDDHETVAGVFDLAHAMACEIVYENDEAGPYKETPEERFIRIRKWAVANLVSVSTPPSPQSGGAE